MSVYTRGEKKKLRDLTCDVHDKPWAGIIDSRLSHKFSTNKKIVHYQTRNTSSSTQPGLNSLSRNSKTVFDTFHEQEMILINNFFYEM